MSSTVHEDFARAVHTKGPSDRNFGLVFTAAFLFFGVWPLRHNHPIRPWCLAVAGAILVITAVHPSLLRRPNIIWTKLGVLIGKVVNPVVTALLFYLTFTPLGFLLRWTGKDLLGLASDPNAETYWIQRDSSTAASSMQNQF